MKSALQQIREANQPLHAFANANSSSLTLLQETMCLSGVVRGLNEFSARQALMATTVSGSAQAAHIRAAKAAKPLAYSKDAITWRWQELLDPLTSASLAIGQSLRSHQNLMAAVSMLAIARIDLFEWENIASVFGDGPTNLLRRRSFQFARSYSDLSESIGSESGSVESLSTAAFQLAPYELDRAIEVIASIGGIEEIEGSDSDAAGIWESEIEQSLEKLLLRCHPDLVSLWRGAREAYSYKNTDYVRHVSVSLRELLTQVLHRLAPDHSVREWTDNPAHFHDDGPTRRARLLYLSRGFHHAPLDKFVRADVEAALAVLNVIQATTHQPLSPVTDQQLRVLILRMEGLVRYLLLLHWNS